MNKTKFKNFIHLIYTSFFDDYVSLSSAKITYHFIMSIVPFLIVFLNILLYLSSSNIDSIYKIMHFLPKESYDIFTTLIKNIINYKSTSIFSVSLIFALWASSSAIKCIIQALNHIFDVKCSNNFSKLSLKVYSLLSH